MKGCRWLAVLLWGSAFASIAQEPDPISLEFQDAPVAVVLQALADHQQLNVVTAAGVGGNLTLRLDKVPWRRALAVSFRMGKLPMTREGNVMLGFPEPS